MIIFDNRDFPQICMCGEKQSSYITAFSPTGVESIYYLVLATSPARFAVIKSGNCKIS